MPRPLGRKKRASAPPSIKTVEIFTDRTDEMCVLLRHSNVQFFVSVYICLCNSAIIAKTSRHDETRHESYLITYFFSCCKYFGEVNSGDYIPRREVSRYTSSAINRPRGE